ncbi:hypothetical protein N431DRAFT_465662 [Stipitochalara longipes BDJ]|nr:hypothetical protein N431DRAFT_465662 [Stipitochalara longipes BDJ]
MFADYTRNEMKLPKGDKSPRAFKSVDEIRLPKNKDLDSWRTYIEDGEREFCEHEIAILKKYVRRITGIHKRLLFPERFKCDRATTICLWNQYIESRQTPAEATERSRSLINHMASIAAATLEAAREKLNDDINANPAIIEYIRQSRRANEVMKAFDFSSGRLPRRQGRKDRPLRVRMDPKVYPVHIICPHVAALRKIEDTPIASHFTFNFEIPKLAAFLFRKDPNIGKHMVKPGRESPLRQSVSLHQVDDS